MLLEKCEELPQELVNRLSYHHAVASAKRGASARMRVVLPRPIITDAYDRSNLFQETKRRKSEEEQVREKKEIKEAKEKGEDSERCV